MSSARSVPPLRDLPRRRLVQRMEHLRGETSREQRPLVVIRRRTTALVFVALVLVTAATLLATPAFGLREQIVHFFAAEKEQRPPEVIQRYFRNMTAFERPGEPTGVIAGKARVAIRLGVPGYGHEKVWVAPTRSGGYCSNLGCDRNRRTRFTMSLEIAGPTSRSSPRRGSGNQHVFFEGATIIRAARTIAVQFEDGSAERMPLAWVSKPIDAGFFVYVLPKSRWKPGRRPLTFVVEDAKGRELAGDSESPADFTSAQLLGFAPPPSGLSRWWFLLPAAFVGLLAAGVFLRRRVPRIRHAKGSK